jgi:hypothetical protein
MAYHQIIKSFRDYADDIEAVNIHYVVTPIGEAPDWSGQRTTRYMPPSGDGVRLKALKLPLLIVDSSGLETNRYVLHYYFETFRDGDRSYSPLFSEEIVTTGPSAGNMAEAAADLGMEAVLAN